ncbi:MAG: glycosyltransferase [Marivita sp.]|uniref:glycosyltransferase n=1 Tax=Marivita sp. TaxID=2003365 RepID=UPI003EF7767E
MSHQRIFCILPKLGKNVGGGKLKAVFTRMNLLVERPDTDVVLLNLTQSCAQHLAFAKLQASGVLDRRIKHLSLHDLWCASTTAPATDAIEEPDWDCQKATTGRKDKRTYLAGKKAVMWDTTEQTVAGALTTRRFYTLGQNHDVRLKSLNGDLIEGRVTLGDGVIQHIAYVGGCAVCRTTYDHKVLQSIDDLTLDKTYATDADHHRALIERDLPQECVVFIDGITVSHLSPAIRAPKVLFLHADHRRPDGSVLPRSRARIEAFDGDAIVTATHVHKTRLEADTRHRAPIRVIPHYTTMVPKPAQTRRHICTVSRLDLTGKPIHQCIEAFTRIMHLIPECNYLIYGSGLGHARLDQLIRHHGCGDRVILMGPTQDPSAVFSACLFSLAPTVTEGFGLSLLESLTCGCPVISYDVDYGPRELITPGQNGELVAPGDIDALAQAILKLHQNRDPYSAHSIPSVQPYSFDAYTARYHDLIDDLSGRGFGFDVMADDMASEVRRALITAPMRHRLRLLDLSVQLCEDRRDIEGLYAAFQQKHALCPEDPQPVKRCVWLSRRLGRLAECHAHLDHLAARFPQDHARFVTRFPEFLDLAAAASLYD